MSEQTGSRGFTHLDASGAARMVDVSAKAVTVREATATGLVRCSAAVVQALRDDDVPKGDVLAVARIAGIQATKRTPDLVPLAHPVAVHGVVMDVEVVAAGVALRATVRTAERTGVEMEALTGATVAALTIYDMCKAFSHDIVIESVRLVEKTGGKSDFHRSENS